MQEDLIKWNPIENLANKYYIESISSDVDYGFTIKLSEAQNKHNKLLIKFDDTVEFFRCTNESFTYKRLDSLVEKYGLPFMTEWTLFKVSNSKDIQWMVSESYGMTTGSEFTHFCIFAIDSVVDVIAGNEPEVTHIKAK